MNFQHPDFVALQLSQWLKLYLYCKWSNNGTSSLPLQAASLYWRDLFMLVSLNECQGFAGFGTKLTRFEGRKSIVIRWGG